ncbi:tyrosine-type recombinase/integrase [Calidifontibacillus oryziterrae]|uniref:tyrosine-type recombinase/integrase n=1 Tax=Calidifontibacillus oryziterrae TaxID=1191699 RepID=UPI0002FDFC63|nr:tyrosine-type recombinase/integrase [Calidifontibacillus oryziterrae]
MNYIEDYKTYLENEDKSVNTIKSYIDTIEKFQVWLQDNFQINNPKIIAVREIKLYRENLLTKLSPTSVNQKISAIKTFYEFLLEQKEIYESPAKKIKLQKIEDHFESQYLTRAEELAILCTAKDMGIKIFALVLTLMKSGIRVGEASRLKVNDVFLNENPTILIKNSKRQKSRYIPISDDVAEALNEWFKERNRSEKIYHKRSDYVFTSQRNGKLSERGIQLILKKIGQKNNIKLYPIRLRATYANNLLQTSGIPINMLASLMGHSNVSTTQRYASPSMTDKRKYIDKLSEI